MPDCLLVFEYGFGEYWGQIYSFLQIRDNFLISISEYFLCYTYWIFYFRKLVICFITFAFHIYHISFDCVIGFFFSFFPVFTKIISDLYSMPYSIFSHVYFVLYCSSLSTSSLRVPFESKFVSFALQSFHLILWYIILSLSFCYIRFLLLWNHP